MALHQGIYPFKSMFKRLLMPPGKFTWQGLTENMLFWSGAKRQVDPVDYLVDQKARKGSV